MGDDLVEQIQVLHDLDHAAKAIQSDTTERRPFILRGFHIGACREKWTPEYLQQIHKPVKIHVCSEEKMDFISKNFLYKTLDFGELIKRTSGKEKHAEFFINESEKYYLRSLGEDERKDVSDIKTQFPQLADDIVFPPLFEQSKYFSSVFRIGSPYTRLWTHYDIMDNMLIQVTGSKKVVFFEPKDVDKLYMKGDKSEVLDIDNPDLEKYPLFATLKRHECTLLAGDVLFIPALWFHNVVTYEFSIAVNVFWRHLDEQFYEKKDLYGNKDLVPFQKAVQSTEKCIKELNSLPAVYRDFYIKRIIELYKQSLPSD